jgi:flagellar motor switch/type III secretory pathway protein FliN
VQLTPASPRPGPEPDELALVIASRTVDFLALAAIGSGARCFVGDVGGELVAIRHKEQTVARGDLIVWRGALGVRITEV